MHSASYNQFCPVAMAAEILGARWTIVLLRELCAGSTRFNDLRRGVPRMSPALLSKRLKELEVHGVIQRRLLHKAPEAFDYVLTEAGRELTAVILSIGKWGQRWIETEASLEHTDPDLLMWDMRRNVVCDRFPERRLTVRFAFADQRPAWSRYWLLYDPESGTDICKVDPGFDVDLFVNTDLRTMTRIWMGVKTLGQALEDERLVLVGDSDIAQAMGQWLGLSPFATERKNVP